MFIVLYSKQSCLLDANCTCNVGKVQSIFISVVPYSVLPLFRVFHFRAVGTGQVGWAAAGPKFTQLTRTKMPFELRQVLFLLQEHAIRDLARQPSSKRSLLEAGGKHTLSPNEAQVLENYCELLTIDRE